MQTMSRAANAYQRVAACRSVREQEADTFRYAIGSLRAAKQGNSLDRTRAVADNRRLWLAVHDLVSDPSNALPTELRASIISISRVMRREMEREAPDLDFLISINEHFAAGLSGQG